MPYATPQLRHLRRATGVKVGPFAAEFNISTGHLSGVERGKQPASYELLHLIAGRLGVEVDVLIAEDVA